MTDRPNIHFSSERDDWPTPTALFATLDTEFRFTLDAAASHDNAKVPTYYTEEDDGLAQPWRGRVFVNPPYSKGGTDRWVEKAIQSVRSGDAELVVMLVPARPGSRWFEALTAHADEMRFLPGRVTFEGAPGPAPFPSAVFVLRPRPEWASDDPTVTFRLPTRHDYSRLWTTFKAVRGDD